MPRRDFLALADIQAGVSQGHADQRHAQELGQGHAGDVLRQAGRRVRREAHRLGLEWRIEAQYAAPQPCLFEQDPLAVRPADLARARGLQRIAEGKSTKEIAASLELGIKTVESHRISLMRELGIHETATLVRYAVRRGLITA